MSIWFVLASIFALTLMASFAWACVLYDKYPLFLGKPFWLLMLMLFSVPLGGCLAGLVGLAYGVSLNVGTIVWTEDPLRVAGILATTGLLGAGFGFGVYSWLKILPFFSAPQDQTSTQPNEQDSRPVNSDIKLS